MPREMTAPAPTPVAWLAGGLMLVAGIAAHWAQPTAKLADVEQPIVLERMIPRQFGDWREVAQNQMQLVNPQQQQLLDKLYSQTLSRSYVNSAGYRIMLSLAYGDDQREHRALQAHKPEVCYPAQGFVIQASEAAVVPTASGDIPVRRLFATMGLRHEPLTYWFTIGDTAVRDKLQKRLIDLRYGLTGLIPDGLLFRVSSIDSDVARAYRVQDDFIQQLLRAVPAADRRRLSGLVDA
jgi:EpsI family protein